MLGKSKQVTTTGANIFDANSVKSYTEGSMEIRNNKNGTITFKGTNNSELPTNYNLDKNGKIVLSAGYWTVSADGLEKCSLAIQTKDNKIFKELKSGSFTFDNPVEQGLTFFLIQCKAGETVEETVSVYLEKGNNALKEPYTGGKPSPSPEYPQEITSCGESGTIDLKIAGDNAEPQTLTIPTPNGLLGLKVDVNGNYTDENGQQWIADEIDLARGKYVQRIAKKIIDGSEELADNIGSKTSYFLKVNDARSDAGMCNYGKRIPITGQKQEELTFSIDDNGIYLYTTKTAVEFKNELKQKYDSGKPVEVLYALKTPIETDLPPETISAFKKLHTNYPTTIVSNNAEAGMELTYTVDTQSYVDSKIAEINMQVVNTQKQLLQERSK